MARLEGPVEVPWSRKSDHYTRLPTDAELDATRDFSDLHDSSNETVEGQQFRGDLSPA